MKKVLAFSMLTAVALSACAYNSKQPTDDTYYKKTQGIAWPEEQKSVATKSVAKAKTQSASYGASKAANPQLN